MKGWNGDDEPARRKAAAWLLLLATIFVVYASLYPFQFDAARLELVRSGEWWRNALRPPPTRDLVANLLFYLPFGALVARAAPAPWGGARRLLAAIGAGTLLSACMETAQLFVVQRHSALTDVGLNAVSTGLGAAAALALGILGVRVALPRLRGRRPDPIALLLILAWIAFHSAPFMPTARFVRLFQHPELIVRGEFTVSGAAGFFAGYLLLSAITRSLLAGARPWRPYAILVAASLVMRVMFRGQALTVDEVAGLAAAILALVALRRVMDERELFRREAVYAAVAVALQGVLPLDFSSLAPSLAWLDAPQAVPRSPWGEPGWIELAYLYGGIVWLFGQAGVPLRRALPALLAGALAVELVQAWHPGRAMHLIAPAIVLAAAVLVRARQALTGAASSR